MNDHEAGLWHIKKHFLINIFIGRKQLFKTPMYPYFAECGLRNAESFQGVICRKSGAEHSANYPLLLFRIPQPKNSAFPRIAKLPFARVVQQMCNWCIAASGVPRSFPSVFIVVHLPKKRVVVLQFRLTSKSLPHFKCHVISLVDVIGFNLCNRCDSHTDNP